MNSAFSESNHSGLYFCLTPKANSLNRSGSFLRGVYSPIVTFLPSLSMFFLAKLTLKINIYSLILFIKFKGFKIRKLNNYQSKSILIITFQKSKKIVELRGIEPRAFPMRRERDTSTPQPRGDDQAKESADKPQFKFIPPTKSEFPVTWASSDF